MPASPNAVQSTALSYAYSVQSPNYSASIVWDICYGNNAMYAFLETYDSICGDKTSQGKTWGWSSATYTSTINEEACQYHSGTYTMRLWKSGFTAPAPPVSDVAGGGCGLGTAVGAYAWMEVKWGADDIYLSY